MTSIEDSKFFIRSSISIDDGGILEEMCETLILAIVMVLWKGVVDSDDAAWTVCCLLTPSLSSWNVRLGSWANFYGTSSSSSRI
jgi:hypothetical protein